jgi:SAM-dependent methyltransferase
MQWPWEMVEADHDIQNPTSREKIRLLGEYLQLGPTSRVLDVACGKAGPALILASEFGCEVVGVELRAGFAGAARARIAAAGLDHLITIETQDAKMRAYERDAFDAALCLGASFIWGWIGDAAEVLRWTVKVGGFLAIGEPYWRSWPLQPELHDGGYVSLDETTKRFEQRGLAITGIIAASEDDWDHYESLHWRALEEWLRTNPDHTDAVEIRDRHEQARRDYFSFQRSKLGWAILVGRIRA